MRIISNEEIQNKQMDTVEDVWNHVPDSVLPSQDQKDLSFPLCHLNVDEHLGLPEIIWLWPKAALGWK